MFGGYAEGIAYASSLEEEELEMALPVHNVETGSVLCADVMPSTSLFGGFEMCPQEDCDFILIAECSEIYGPNPICTIPSTVNADVNLNSLSVLILSADYQEFSSNKSVPTKDTQVLIPDVMDGIHAAVNHFVVYDAEARGFVRSLCFAYVTSDKHKLVKLDKEIFKSLSDASLFVQYSNRKFSKKGLEVLMKDLESTKSDLHSFNQLDINKMTRADEKIKLYDQLIKSSLQDIHDILKSIDSSKVMEDADKLIDDFIDDLIKKLKLERSHNLLYGTDDELTDSKRTVVNLPIQQNFDKPLRSLFIVSPRGAVMAFYHLHMIYKFFRRKYEDIFMQFYNNETEAHDDHLTKPLHFGACLKLHSWVKGPSNDECDVNFEACCINLSDRSSDYTSHIDLNFWTHIISVSDSVSYEESTLDLIKIAGLKIEENDVVEAANLTEDANSRCSKHIVTLSQISDVFDHLNSKFPGIESSVLQFLQSFQWLEDILFSLFIRIPIVISYSLEEEFIISHFVRVSAALTPRIPGEELLVEHHREKPLQKQDLAKTAIVTFCIQRTNSKLIPSEIMPFVLMLNLRTASSQGPKYRGSLLSKLNSKIKAMSPTMPFFPLLTSILMEIETQVKFWKSVSSCGNTTQRNLIMMQKGFSKCDLQILKSLAK